MESEVKVRNDGVLTVVRVSPPPGVAWKRGTREREKRENECVSHRVDET